MLNSVPLSHLITHASTLVNILKPPSCKVLREKEEGVLIWSAFSSSKVTGCKPSLLIQQWPTTQVTATEQVVTDTVQNEESHAEVAGVEGTQASNFIPVRQPSDEINPYPANCGSFYISLQF